MTIAVPPDPRLTRPTDVDPVGLRIGLRRYVTVVNGGRTAYVDQGEGPTVVLLHGAPMTSLGFVRVIRELSRDHRVVAPDLPGFGKSECPSSFGGTLVCYARFVEAFCDTLGLTDYILYLNDSSGSFGLSAAASRSRDVRGLVVADTVAIPLTGRAWPVKQILKYVITSAPMRWLNRYFNLLPYLVATVAPMLRPFSADERKVLRAEFSRHDQRDRVLHLFEQMASDDAFMRVTAERVRRRLAMTPTLLLFGQLDPMRWIGSIGRFKRLLPRHTVVIIPFEEHFPILASGPGSPAKSGLGAPRRSRCWRPPDMASNEDVQTFERHRPELLGVAYRLLGDYQRSEDIVQDAWLRWQRRQTDPVVPKAFLIKTVTRLCINELGSARARREESRGDRLPEPVNLEASGLERLENLDAISMAFLVILQRLTAAERAVLLLHDVFDYSHVEVAGFVDKSESACRQLLRRARQHVAATRRTLCADPGDHRRLLRAFVAAATTGDADALAHILADDVTLTVDVGPKGRRYGGVRNLPGPLRGAAKVVPFLATVAPRGAEGLRTAECELNGQPAVVVLRECQPVTAILVSTDAGRISAVFMHADPDRLSTLVDREARG